MKLRDTIYPSSQVNSTLPDWIAHPDSVVTGIERSFVKNGVLTRTSLPNENYRNFVNFMTKSAESEERIGFSQDILQNLLEYRDFLSYKQKIVEYSILAPAGTVGSTLINNILDDLDENDPIDDSSQSLLTFEPDLIGLSETEEESMSLMDGTGFPLTNGVVMVIGDTEDEDEIILYRKREGNNLIGLLRGASATIILPSFRRPGKYLRTQPKKHSSGVKVVNVSCLFLNSILDSIHKTFTHSIDSDNVSVEINRSTFLTNVKEFFRSKGSKLGIKSLFKIIFAENDVEVFHPGDRMMIPSKSTWFESLMIRSIPVPEVFCNPRENYALPDRVIGSEIVQRTYSGTVTDIILDDETIENYDIKPTDLLAKSVVEYATSYQNGAQTQYELYLNKDEIRGKFVVNPFTVLTNDVNKPDNTDADDFSPGVHTIVVESTAGFPDRGIIFINGEAIYYKDRTANEFLECERGYIGVDDYHTTGTYVFGPYYVEGKVKDKDGVEYVSRSWPVGLVSDVDIKEPGLLHEKTDDLIVNGPGSCPVDDPILCVLNEDNEIKRTFIENEDDQLIDQRAFGPTMAYVEDRSTGINGIYFDKEFSFISTSGNPYYQIGNFVKSDNPLISDAIGLQMKVRNQIHVVPKRLNIKENIISEIIVKDLPVREYTFSNKGTDIIGIATDGVRYFSNNSDEIISQGRIASFNIINKGFGYINPTLVVYDDFSGVYRTDQGTITVDPLEGLILKVTPSVTQNNYTNNPPARISSGEGAVLTPTLDRYGRIISVSIDNPGRYYNDQPTIKALDPSGVGKGALIGVEVNNGEIVAVNIVNSGIDYQQGTSLQVIPVGNGAEIEAITEFYRFNRYNQVTFKNEWEYDIGNGFLYPDPFTPYFSRELYGYVCSPKELRDHYVDDGSQHSPILGFAFDGNPIYGPYGYTNGKDDSYGVIRQRSGYRLLPNRTKIIPDGGLGVVGLKPPSTGKYPLGSFIEDYIYDPFYSFPSPPVDPGVVVIRTEEELENLIKTDDTDEVLELDSVQGVPGRVLPNFVLDENNGKICNTPEYPKELYPDGVFCYFITVESDNETPVFPYVIGKTFNNRPTSQVVNLKTKETLQIIPRQNFTYSSSVLQNTEAITFDLRDVDRFRVPYLTSTKDEIDLSIQEVSKGSLSEVLVQNLHRTSTTSKVGDYIFFNNEGSGGVGAEAKVSFVEGVEVVSAMSEYIRDEIVSHRQVLNLFGSVDNNGDLLVLTFTEGSLIEFNGDDGTTIAKIIRWDSGSRDLEVAIRTERLVQLDDSFYDAKTTLTYVTQVDTLDEPPESDILWTSDTRNFLVGDKIRIYNGDFRDLDDNGETEYYIDEESRCNTIINDKSFKVDRGFYTGRPVFEIEDKTPVLNLTRYFYTVTTSKPHTVKVGDEIYINYSEFDEVNGKHVVAQVSQDQMSFSIYVSEMLGTETNHIVYEVNDESVMGKISRVMLTSGGLNYERLPKIEGISNRYIDRAEIEIVQNGGVIDEIELVHSGRRYTNPKALIFDRTFNGNGAIIDLTHSRGVITNATITDGGDNYVEPYCVVVDDIGKFLCITDDIGKLKSFDVNNPGRNLSIDRSLKPEVIVDTKIVVRYTRESLHEFKVGETLFTGIDTNKTAIGVVKDYDSETQTITFIPFEEDTKIYENKILGRFKVGDYLYNHVGTIGEVVLDGQARSKVVIGALASPKGKFLDDTSKLANGEDHPYSVIQDSERYQWFSYVISSPLQEVNYKTFVDRIIHPTGFTRFSEVRLNTSVDSSSYVNNFVQSVETIFYDPCDPLPLLVSQNLDPILSVDLNGDTKVILVTEKMCDGGPGAIPIPPTYLPIGNLIIASDVDEFVLSIDKVLNNVLSINPE